VFSAKERYFTTKSWRFCQRMMGVDVDIICTREFVQQMKICKLIYSPTQWTVFIIKWAHYQRNSVAKQIFRAAEFGKKSHAWRSWSQVGIKIKRTKVMPPEIHKKLQIPKIRFSCISLCSLPLCPIPTVDGRSRLPYHLIIAEWMKLPQIFEAENQTAWSTKTHGDTVHLPNHIGNKPIMGVEETPFNELLICWPLRGTLRWPYWQEESYITIRRLKDDLKHNHLPRTWSIT
jgi:hypothetical protein